LEKRKLSYLWQDGGSSVTGWLKTKYVLRQWRSYLIRAINFLANVFSVCCVHNTEIQFGLKEIYLLWLYPYHKSFRATCRRIDIKTTMGNLSWRVRFFFYLTIISNQKTWYAAFYELMW
jgi:hypothetical protein